MATMTIKPVESEDGIRLSLDEDVPDPVFVEFVTGDRRVRYVRDNVVDDMQLALQHALNLLVAANLDGGETAKRIEDAIKSYEESK